MSNIDKQAVTAKTKELASFMVERFSMNPVSCKLLNEAWKKEFPDEVAIAERMLALLDELEHYKSREERVTKLVLDNSTSWDALYKKLEAAERRIAEHCKVLNSLAAVARRYLPDYDEHPEIQAADELLESAAGIGVKQQEDIVDSDVGSRNQPGTVTAIYIGAGDFVKVKGQVFEVEETDFDDHDVTLWFVGGNALKCSAGCPVEVVSAPVAAGIKVKGE
ncbi:ead/Ea22-like family protein [Salmonella enterica]|uniref:Phage protein n=1 Tax=Salmonella derby TaxID=28144 RepID=A0A1S7BGE4_SALDE|nr:ead/Ea22-like family protein [Salmonella enterica]AQX82737.1 Phage protein [Salmonella enterica subsp. enterica serovar Derby]MDO3790773.1 ead/Ea22-like family protein [Salmonella enterica]MDO3795205.1 ead/Ea22-like family protein [Salmonella enterica]MDO3799866.1 ead/Ea22-like family protein [Salmonella enterica]MDO3813362.1 ead/Ea22-like family protein [Salmonella enterica]